MNKQSNLNPISRLCATVFGAISPPSNARPKAITSNEKLQQYFHVESPNAASPLQIRRYVLIRLPIGTTREDLTAFLSESGIRIDPQCRVSFSNATLPQDYLTLRINDAPTKFTFVTTSYDITFHLNDDRINDVTVRRNLTGL